MQHEISARMSRQEYALHTRSGASKTNIQTELKARLKNDLRTAWIYPSRAKKKNLELKNMSSRINSKSCGRSTFDHDEGQQHVMHLAFSSTITEVMRILHMYSLVTSCPPEVVNVSVGISEGTLWSGQFRHWKGGANVSRVFAARSESSFPSAAASSLGCKLNVKDLVFSNGASLFSVGSFSGPMRATRATPNDFFGGRGTPVQLSLWPVPVVPKPSS